SRGEVKGEITLLIAKADEGTADAAPERVSIRQRVAQVMAEKRVDEKAALKKVAKELGVSKSEAYRELQRSKEIAGELRSPGQTRQLPPRGSWRHAQLIRRRSYIAPATQKQFRNAFQSLKPRA